MIAKISILPSMLASLVLGVHGLAAQEAAPKPALPAYVLGPGDLLDVKFFYEPELNEQQPIRPDGRIALQLIGDVTAAGLTPTELQAALRERYSHVLRQPDVTVIVREISGRRIYVGGEVGAPGLLKMAGSLSALQAIFEAGGPKRSGQLSSVVVLRYQGTNEPRFMTLDLTQAVKRTSASGDVPLEPLDIVFVPKTRIARMNDFVDQYVRQLIPIPMSLGISYVFGGILK
jgi:protein involved in polysaccharide export with SLBB domain